MTPEEKIASLEHQIADCENGLSNLIICPYCKGENWKPGTGPEGKPTGLCCKLLSAAAQAILDRQEQDRELQKLAEFADKVACN